jgi:hypothetical protein
MQERVKRKSTVSLEIDADLAAAAVEAGLDLAPMLEHALAVRLACGSSGGLSDADRAAIDAHNRYIAEHGTLAESLRDD